jgi:hypothetical protein
MFGGPEPPITDLAIFERFPFMDVVIKGEGEITFQRYLEAILTKNTNTVPGLLINDNGTVVNTGDSVRIENLDDLPSPYTTGIFDKLIADNPDVEWNSTLETNRGCPYQCTFCDWGSLTYNKVKKFDLDRVYEELDWMAAHKCGHMSICDANFGMFVERDNLIADKIIALQTEFGYPYTFNASWAKMQKAEVINIVKKLFDSPTFNHGLTLSVQSLNGDVLDAIKRKNLGMHQISEVFAMAEKQGVPVNTELILGLPAETLTSWMNNLWKLFEAGNHTGIEIFQAQLLENAEMNTGQRVLHKIKSTTVYDYMSGSYNDDVLAEGVDVVVSTRAMPLDDMLDAQCFSWFVNTLHINGLTTFASRFMRKFLDVSYSDFYNGLYGFLMRDTWFKKEHDDTRQYYSRWMIDGRINHPSVGNIPIHGWNLIHRTTINIHAEDKYDHMFDLIDEYLKQFRLTPRLYQSVCVLHRNYIVQHKKLSEYPVVAKVDYDVLGYLQGESLVPKKYYTFDFTEAKDMTFAKFLELIYFSRRRNFGKTTIGIQ